MKSIMSINKKFFDISPKKLYELVKEYHIDGFEIYINFLNKSEIEYLERLVYICRNNNILFQVHGDSSLTIKEQIEFLNSLEKISDILGYKITVVIHPLTLDTKEESINATIDYVDAITKSCDNSKITISLENLNDDGKNDRLDKFDIAPIIINNENVYMTFDLGHEISEYGKITNINENVISLITNVHIHTMNNFYSQGFDHKPIYKNDEHWNKIIKGILFLKNNKYDGPIVFEYDLYACEGNTIEEKIISYAKSIEWVSERFK